MRLTQKCEGDDIDNQGASAHKSTEHYRVAAIHVVLLPIFAVCLCTAPPSRADERVMLMVPSAAMGRDIPVAFQAGGPHAVVLLDAFNAAPDESRWVETGAFQTLSGRGLSVAAPAGGAWTLFTDWEADRSKQWETFLAEELPSWLAANEGLAPGGHAVVGASQGGTAALTLAEFHPDRYRFAGSLSGFLNPSATSMNGALTAALARFGGVDTQLMWGAAQLGRWKPHDPTVHAELLAVNNTRVWIYSPTAQTCSDPLAMIGYCDQAQGSNRSFYVQYGHVGGHNAHFDFPSNAQHDWTYWGPQIDAMADELVATLR